MSLRYKNLHYVTAIEWLKTKIIKEVENMETSQCELLAAAAVQPVGGIHSYFGLVLR